MSTKWYIFFCAVFADKTTGNYSENLHHAISGVSNNNVFLLQMEGYDIVTAKEEDRESIAEFLRQSFIKHEPLIACTGIDLSQQISESLKLQIVSEGTSLLAVSRNGRHILGVCLNQELKRNEHAYSSKQHSSTDPNDKVGRFIEKVEAKADIWKKLDAPRAILIHILSVDPESSGRGIGRALMETTRDKAQCEGYQAICIFCSSHFSAKIARSMGMECVYSLPYSEYKDEDGNPVIKPSHPHTEFAVFVQELSSQT
jgi:predicted N-acetyltransferase YhbS